MDRDFVTQDSTLLAGRRGTLCDAPLSANTLLHDAWLIRYRPPGAPTWFALAVLRLDEPPQNVASAVAISRDCPRLEELYAIKAAPPTSPPRHSSSATSEPSSSPERRQTLASLSSRATAPRSDASTCAAQRQIYTADMIFNGCLPKLNK